ncbi:MAG: DUF4350 domain-containing protein, partial [Allosphingosinicella sp.]
MYGSALLLAGLSETIFVTMLGASRPWLELTRGLAAGAVVVAILDVAVQAGRRLLGRRGAYLAAGLVALLFLSPYGLRFYDALLIGEEQQEAAVKPDVMLMTALPLIWGETGPFDPASRPASSYLALKREFKVMPLDFLDKSTLGAGRLLLLAHPRALAPEELVALDDWVRQGGRVLILTDPWLSWPTKLPLGDARRPPPAGLLGPLLDHWGVVVEAPESGRLVRVRHVTEQGVRRLTMAAPGRFRIKAQSCATGPYYMARCRVGEGEAILIADADLMRDDLWRAPGPMGDKRAARSADNPLVVADLLDSLGKMERSRISESVQWAVPGRSRAAA